MKRLLETMRLDVRLQLRNGFAWAIAVVVAAWVAAVTQLGGVAWAVVLPAFVFGNLVVVSFYFVAGLVLLEKEEGTLEAQVVTPLASGEYLVSKVATLAALSVVESLLVTVIAVGFGFGAFAMTAGIVLASVLYTLIGFATVARYDTINEYIFPSVVYTTLLGLPYLHYFSVWENPILYLHPLLGPLILMQAAFGGASPWQWAYGLLYPLLCVIPIFLWSRRAFERFVVMRQGAI